LKQGIPVGIQLTIAACLRGRQRVDWVLAPASQPRQKLTTQARERWPQLAVAQQVLKGMSDEQIRAPPGY
jgi:hypothetical protein